MVRRSPVGESVNIEAVHQQNPDAGYPSIIIDPASLNRGRRHRTEHNYNETVKDSDPGPEPVIQTMEQIFKVYFTARDTTFLTEAASKQWLAEAGEQLDECSSCAAEEELPPPSGTALIKSRELLQQFSVCIASQPDIYPMDKSGIAIDFRTPDGRSGVLFVVDQDGSGAMFFRTDGMRGRTRVEDATQLIKEGAIAKLRRVGIW